MFSNVNEVIEHLRLADIGGYRFAIDWTVSCYRDPQRHGDPWEYYFKPVYPDLPFAALEGQSWPELPRGVPVACTVANIITPRLKDGACHPLLLPRDRHSAHALIARHLHLNDDVTDIIEDFAARHFNGPIIGLHTRGPGRIDGGAATLRRNINPDGGVPFEVYFDAVDAALRQYPDARIFSCSDSSMVIENIHARYGSRVITYDATRSAFGEMHARHPENAGQSFDAYTLGLDVLVEAYLLTRCDILVHGNSNVANFVLCAKPDLPHQYVLA